jgi:hypothetical protein
VSGRRVGGEFGADSAEIIVQRGGRQPSLEGCDWTLAHQRSCRSSTSRWSTE